MSLRVSFYVVFSFLTVFVIQVPATAQSASNTLWLREPTLSNVPWQPYRSC
jgi:hypothetical protein